MNDEGQSSGKPTRGLLGDLESIRSLLEEEEQKKEAEGKRPEGRAHGQEAAEPTGDDDVPLLEDVVHGGVSVNETFLSGQGDFEESEGSSGLNEEIFKALLSDEWRESARELLDEARSVIEKHQTEWTPAHTDELNQALKVRIDETVQQWLQQVVQERLHELRGELLGALNAEIQATIRSQFEPTPPKQDEDPDGE